MKCLHIILIAIALLVCSCTTSHTVIVKGNPRTMIYADYNGEKLLGVIDKKGELKLKVDDDGFVPVLFSKSKDSNNIVPFGIDTKKETHKSARFLEGMSCYLPPFIGVVYYFPLNWRNNQLSHAYQFAPKKTQTTNEDLVLAGNQTKRKTKVWNKPAEEPKAATKETPKTSKPVIAENTLEFPLPDGAYKVTRIDIPSVGRSIDTDGKLIVAGKELTFKVPDNQYMSDKQITLGDKTENTRKVEGTDKDFVFYNSTSGELGFYDEVAFADVRLYGIYIKINGIDMIVWAVR